MDVLESLDNLQSAAFEEEQKKKQNNPKPEFHFDKLKMYFGEDCTLHEINISIPKIGDILQIGESSFYNSVSPFLNNPTSIRVFLYDTFHKDWTKTKDIEVFFILLQLVKDKAPLKLIFKDFLFDDIQLVKAKKKDDDKEYDHLALVSPSQGKIIYDDEYLEIAEYIRTMFHVHLKTEKGKGKTTKLWMLQEDRMKVNEIKEKKENDSTLLPLISSCLNHPGFKYKLEELKDVNFYYFMDAVSRIQKYEQSNAALHGVFSGMISSKDLPQNLINYMSSI
jgi:hypothetical protein